ncbi:MAG: PQQ-dependent sugar dehydrogenase [Myxococcaceae bacterium]|nr:PQQ-dependent sugar dehydrogenase [Myxococcaceae bacterium]
MPTRLLCLLLIVGCNEPGRSDAGPPPDSGELPPDSGMTPRQILPFPLETPSVNGYAVVDAFPDARIVLPMAMVWPKVGPQSPFFLDRWGRVLQIEQGRERQVLDIRARVKLEQEGGALGMALHPSFGDGTGPSPYVYVWYNSVDSTQRLARFTWDAGTRTFGSELVLLDQLEVRTGIHNAGHVAFGPDGFLYFGNGDDADPMNHQTLSRALFAGLFRIDVDMRGGAISHPAPKTPAGATTAGYFIPNDNPFVGVAGALEEFYALGLRNPFCFSFDRMTGSLYAADVGEVWREEVNRIVPGGNYEWPLREGELELRPGAITIGTAQAPVYAYTHAEMGELSSIVGGFVYRGAALPELQGRFIYSDWPSTRVWAVDVTGPVPRRVTLVDIAAYGDAMGFAEDNDGEIYLLRQSKVMKITRAPAPAERLPQKLSETVLFADLQTAAAGPGFVPYDVVSPLWSDGAFKTRFIRVPEGQRVTADAAGRLTLPVGTVLMKHFELPREPSGRTRRLETRAIVIGSTDTYGVTYRWNPEGTDAELVKEPADEALTFSTEPTSQTWQYPSFGQCWACHRKENRVLGFSLAQLSLTRSNGQPQLDALVAAGVLDASTLTAPRAQLVSPADTSAPLEARAMSYLAANCGHCHHEGVEFHGGLQTWVATPGVALTDRGLVDVGNHNPLVASALGMPNARLVDPGAPDTSLVLGRLRSTNPDLRMAPLGRGVVDPLGAPLIEQWIRSLPP